MNEEKTVNESEKRIIGTCPVCGGEVIAFDGDYPRYACENDDLVLFKRTKLFGSEITVTEDKAKALFRGETAKFRVTTKSGKSYEASYKIDGSRVWEGANGNTIYYANLVKVEEPEVKEEIGVCPICGGMVSFNGKKYLCDNGDWVLNATGKFFGSPISFTSEDVKFLLSGHSVTLALHSPKKDKDYTLDVVLDGTKEWEGPNGKIYAFAQLTKAEHQEDEAPAAIGAD
jgi:ribosomal protein S27AE